jgi:polysaccharide chain length determinant protein (PEP-CTERM system associated)
MRDVGSEKALTDEVRGRSGLTGVLAIWSRRKWLAIIVFAAPVVAGASVISFLPNVYRSTATVLVDRQQVPEAFVRSTVTSALETRLHTISQEVLSRSRLEELIDRFGLYRDLRKRVPLEDVIGRMRSDIKLEIKSAELRGLREATVAFTITYQGSDPETVASVTNTLASFYNEENTKARERQATGTAEFLKIQLNETKTRLDEQEQRVSGFKRRHLGELPQQMDSNLSTLDRLHAQLRQNADSQTRAADRKQSLSGQLAEAESLVSSPYAVAAAGPAAGQITPVAPSELRDAARLAQKKDELAQLRSQFSDKYPDVVQLTAEIAALEREIALAKRAEPKPGASAAASPVTSLGPMTPYVLRLKEALAEVQTDLKVLKTEEGRLRESIAVYQARVDNVPRREQEFKELSRDYESTRELYGSLLKRYEEAQLAESMEQRQKGEQFKVLDPAIARLQPAAPNRLKLLLMAVVGSIGLAFGAVLLAEQIDTSFHDLDDLRSFSNVPVLASIPWIVTRSEVRRRRWRMRLAVSATVTGLAVIVGLAYFVAHGNEHLIMLMTRMGS